MLLADMLVEFQYSQLVKLLKTRYYGAAFANLTLLDTLAIQVEINQSDDPNNIEALTQSVESDHPLIVAVEICEHQSYWMHPTSHAVVVIGIDETNVMLNDPAFEDAPKVVPIDEFLIAWGEQDYRYAILTKK